ncbi:hypothetical protein ACQKE8_26615 [Sphingobium limneticum]|uniref:hypothetical protein n=1 Tax=Sphingobium limneticum TaxID=1007511 RepID=UPI0011AEB941
MVRDQIAQRLPSGEPDLEQSKLGMFYADLSRDLLERLIIRARGRQNEDIERRLEVASLGDFCPEFLLGDSSLEIAILAFALHAGEATFDTIRTIDVDTRLRLPLASVHFGIIRLPHPAVDIERQIFKFLPVLWR